MATDHTQASVYLSRSVHCVPLTLPDRDYFSAAAEMVPCRSIGGNFFDYLDLDGSFGVAVGDVAGKGAAAGLLGGARPGDLLLRGWRGSVHDDRRHQRLDGEEGGRSQIRCRVLRYPVAERRSHILQRRSQSAAAYQQERGAPTDGLILSPFDEATYDHELVTLSPGDTLVTFSDGVSDALNAEDTAFGVDRIVEYVNAFPSDAEPRHLVQQILPPSARLPSTRHRATTSRC